MEKSERCPRGIGIIQGTALVRLTVMEWEARLSYN